MPVGPVWGRGTPLPPLSIYFLIFPPFLLFLNKSDSDEQKWSSVFQQKIGVTPWVAAPVDTNRSDATDSLCNVARQVD